MSTGNASFLERVIRAVRHAFADAPPVQRDGKAERQEPIRWLSLR